MLVREEGGGRRWMRELGDGSSTQNENPTLARVVYKAWCRLKDACFKVVIPANELESKAVHVRSRGPMPGRDFGKL